MKIKIRPDDTSMRRETDWRQMNDWLAELREDGRAEPAGPDDAGPPGHAQAESAASDRTGSTAGPAVPAVPTAPARAVAPARATASAPAAVTARAVIGDELRMPVMWCEMGSCISWHADPAALGEADARARAISAGWRIDAFGRLACPQCQQTDPGFWAACRVVPWDRYTAIARTARVAAGHSDRDADGAAGSSHDPRYAAAPRQPAWTGMTAQAPGLHDPSRLPAPPPYARRD